MSTIGDNLTQLRRKPLTASEFIVPLSKIEPIYAEEEGEFKVEFDYCNFRSMPYNIQHLTATMCT